MVKFNLNYKIFCIITGFFNVFSVKDLKTKKTRESLFSKGKNYFVLVSYIFISLLNVFDNDLVRAQSSTTFDTNYVSSVYADSVIASIELSLDKSGYGFYNMVCVDGYTLNYRLYIPSLLPNIKYPLVFTLPGSGAEGSNNTTQMGGVGASIWGQNYYQSIHPHYSVVPQPSASIPDSNYKTIYANEYKELRDSLIKMYSDIDTNRIYLTGHSAGGSMVYRMLGIFTDCFAAGIPCDGAIGGIHEGYAAMAIWPAVYVANNTPVWMFNGGINDVVKPDQINGMFNIADSISIYGGNPITTYMPYLNHSETEGMYKLETGLFEWLFAQHKGISYGITDIEANNPSITVYPNPASDILYFSDNKNDHFKITIYSEIGIQVIEKEVTAKSIDIHSLSKGIYILKVENRFIRFVKL